MNFDESAKGCSFLTEPISMSDLIGTGARFEIHTNFNDAADEDIFEDIGVGSEDEDDDAFNSTVPVTPWTKSYNELRKQMDPINEHIYKKITKPGIIEGGTVPLNARVEVRYNAYWENDSAPFDSTFLRGSPLKFYTGQWNVLEGLEAAVRTMHRGEQAQFVISYHLLHREMGCPPRIKPRADALFIIELVSFSAVGDLNADEKVPAEDRNKFSVIIEKIKEIHIKGVDFFSQGFHNNAIRAFEKAVNLLLFCRLANETEQREQTEFLIKLYINLALCYLKVKAPAKTCIMCKEIRRLTNNKPSSKALFQEGRALVLLGEYQRARDVLVSAQRLEPRNKEINQELRVLDERYARYKASEKEIWRKAMGVIKASEIEQASAAENEISPFEQEMIDCIKTFKENSETNNLKLPGGLTEKEIESVDKLAKQFDLMLSISPIKNVYSLCKK